MSVVHVETGRHLYGGALQVLYLVRGLLDRGVASVLLAPRGSAVARKAATWGLPVDAFSYAGEGDPRALWALGRRFRRHRAALVHLHSRRGADTLGAVAALPTRVPKILTRRVDHREAPWFAKAKYPLYRHVIAISGAVRDVLVSQGVPKEKVSLVYSGIDAARWQAPRARRSLDREFGVDRGVAAGAMVAQFIPRKGHRVLVTALELLKREGIAPTVVLFGQGSGEREVADLAKAAGVGNQLRFVGFRSDLHDWMGAFDFCVHPAQQEGLGVAALQAGAAGIPVIAASAGGLPEVVVDGETGVLVPPGDAPALAAAIANLAGNGELSRAMGRRARIRVENRFTTDAMVEGNLEVYRGVRSAGGNG